jgi:hypothetical protein
MHMGGLMVSTMVARVRDRDLGDDTTRTLARFHIPFLIFFLIGNFG